MKPSAAMEGIPDILRPQALNVREGAFPAETASVSGKTLSLPDRRRPRDGTEAARAFAERRRHERLDFRASSACVQCRYSLRLFITDLGMGGAGVESIEGFPVGCRMTLFLPWDSREGIRGLVRWVRSEGVITKSGIEFTDLSAEQRILLSRLVRTGSSRKGP